MARYSDPCLSASSLFPENAKLQYRDLPLEYWRYYGQPPARIATFFNSTTLLAKAGRDEDVGEIVTLALNVPPVQ
jgi:hypothetical protein